MSPRYFSIFTIGFFGVVIAAMPASSAYAAEWRECEKAKLRELKLQDGAEKRTTTKKKASHRESLGQRIEEIDTWLWKNCREYSYELRQLEQEHM
ncbi:MAG: hypothetical protein QM709_05645 [Spongiibacteraceae bacterium]